MKIVSGTKGSSTSPKEKAAFGWELIMDLYDCDSGSISNEKKIQHFAKELCKMLDMKPYGEPLTAYFGENSENGRGYSLVQFIETSSITGHFSESNRAAYINLFSSRSYDPDQAEKFTRSYFSAKRMSSRFIIRR
ncbi:MAG: S-adenosylmethionine decarboxylase [Proteobacteria bacterium]|nr:S-adenosylmethionine decarboxylase [Pseudomonadota bacterium]